MTDAVSVRPATVDDSVHVERIVIAAYEPYIERIGRRPAPMTVDYRGLVSTTDQVSVLIDSGTVLGVIITVVELDHVLIENVAVDPSVQGRGYGRMLLGHAEKQARELGLAELRLYTNASMTENLKLYPRLGYAEVARRSEDGFDRVYFVKALRDSDASGLGVSP